MNEQVRRRAQDLREQRVPFVHARVVLAERPTSAKPGDEALVLPDGTLEGFVGGTCAESTVRAQALTLLDSGESVVLRITPVEEESRAGKVSVHNPCLSGGTLEVFLEPVVPAPLVLVHGDTPIGRALARLGAELGWSVATPGAVELADAAAVVVASHGRGEEEVLRAALQAGVAYVGLVASRKRGEAVLASLDLCSSMTSRVRTPAGLDLGARTPEEVALTILAEILASRPQPTGRPVVSEAAVEHALDPVCGMTVAAVESSLHLDHEGRRVWFCGTGCLRAFASDPAAYS
jgi:xanthine dehydrogenase accessory factor